MPSDVKATTPEISEERLARDLFWKLHDLPITPNTTRSDREIPVIAEFLAGYRAAHQWLDIKDAPRDGTPLLLWEDIDGRRGANHQGWVVGSYHEGEWHSERGYPLNEFPPTHYLPLPSPPPGGG